MIENEKWLRIKQILGDPKAKPPILPRIPICKTSWYNGIKSGRYPKGIKISPRTTVWRESDINKLISEGKEVENMLIH